MRSGICWTDDERATLDRLTTPFAIQEFLDAVPYSADPFYRCPRRVLRDRKAHCTDGALFAAAALRHIGHAPLVMDLRAVRDDDHLVAVFRVDGRLGAVAKSNTTGLRYREPVYRTLRELVLSYFEHYFNTEYEKTLRSYSVPLDLGRIGDVPWETEDDAVDVVVARLDAARHHELLTPAMIARLRPVDRRLFDAGFLGADWAGLFRPEKG